MPTAKNRKKMLFDAMMEGIAIKHNAETIQLRVYALDLPILSEYMPVPTLPVALINPPKEARIHALAARKGKPFEAVASIPVAFAMIIRPDCVEPMKRITSA